MATLSEIEPRDLKALLDRGTAVVIDVREPDEHAREHIAGSRLEPLSRFDVGQIPSGGQTVVLHCKGGSRSAEAGARLIAAGRSVTHLKGGLQAWKAAGMPTEVNLNAPIPIMRQVQIIVGSLVLATSILAYAIHPAFLLLTGLFGAGLLFAGTTGICGMAAVLRRMPWNKALRCEGCSHT